MTTQTNPRLATCELAGCGAQWEMRRSGRPPRFCLPHRQRPWHELRAALDRADVRVADLARAADMSPVYVHQVLAGRRHPSPWHVEQVAAALGVPAAEVTPHASTVVPAAESA